jgi:organic hydroperoxide reductase OsmC/OhrA
MAEQQPKQIDFTASIEWRGYKIGEIFVDEEKHSRGLVNPPPVFGGIHGSYNPEHLLLAAVASCTMSSFLYFVNANKIELISYSNSVRGTLTKGKDGFSFTNIYIDVQITVATGNKEKAEEAARLGHRFCLISNSLNSQVEHKFTVLEVEKSEQLT